MSQPGGSFRRRTLIKTALAAGPVIMTIRSRPALAQFSSDSACASANLSNKPRVCQGP
jgi:hypothetical protein